MGWLFVIIFAALTLIGLKWSGRLSRIALELTAVAVLVGVAGYAWQGSPSLPGSPVASTARK